MGNDESSPIILFVILYGGETMECPVPQWTSKQCMPLIDCIKENCTSLALDQMAFPAVYFLFNVLNNDTPLPNATAALRYNSVSDMAFDATIRERAFG